MREELAIIRGPQIRAARALLRLTSQQLADLAGVSRDMIKRAERDTPVPRLHMAGLSRLKKTLEEAGVVFLSDEADRICGVALRTGSKDPQTD